MEYAQTWRERVTPSGLRYSEHTASARRTSDSGCTGWPTPLAQEFDHTDLEGMEARRRKYQEKYGNNGFGLTLGQASALWLSALAGWPTPMAGNPGTEDYNPAGNTDSSRKTVELVAGWATPRANDAKGPPTESLTHTTRGTVRNDTLPLQAATAAASGTPSTSSPAATASGGASRRGALNPAFSCWLMGYPLAWAACGSRALASTRSRSKRSKAGSVCCGVSGTR